jgi:hypothetical protein
MAGSFDDLVPAQGGNGNGTPSAFTDLVPAPQMGGFWRLPAMAGSSLLKGLTTTLGAVGPAEWTAMGEKPEEGPSADAITGLARQAGAVDRPDLKPQTPGERYLAAGMEGAGATLPTALAGPLAAARTVLQGAGGGALGEAAADWLPNHPVLARLAGNLVGGAATGKTFNAAGRLTNAIAGNTTPVVQAYRNLDIDPALAGDVTGSPNLRMLQAYAGRSIGGAGRVENAAEHAVDQWGNALEDTAGALGGSKTLQGAGKQLQLESDAWLNRFRADSKNAWNAVDLAIPPGTPVPTGNYGNALVNVRNQMPGAPNTANVLQPSLSRDLLGALIKDTKLGPLSWEDVKGIRTRIGEKLADPQLVADSGHAELKQLYGALTQDMQAAAAARGPAAVDAFNTAAALTKQGHDFVDGVLSQIKGKNIAPEAAAASVLDTGYNGGTALKALRDQMPRATDELAAYKLRDMGLATPGQQNATATRLSPGSFLTDRARLAPEAQDALFGADPAVARRLEDLSTVADSMKGTERFLNTSNSGVHSGTAHTMIGLAGAVPAAIEAFHVGGLPAAAASAAAATIGPFVPSYLAGRMTTSPALTRLLAAPGAVPRGGGLLSSGSVLPAAQGLLQIPGP